MLFMFSLYISLFYLMVVYVHDKYYCPSMSVHDTMCPISWADIHVAVFPLKGERGALPPLPPFHQANNYKGQSTDHVNIAQNQC